MESARSNFKNKVTTRKISKSRHFVSSVKYSPTKGKDFQPPETMQIPSLGKFDDSLSKYLHGQGPVIEESLPSPSAIFTCFPCGGTPLVGSWSGIAFVLSTSRHFPCQKWSKRLLERSNDTTIVCRSTTKTMQLSDRKENRAQENNTLRNLDVHFLICSFLKFLLYFCLLFVVSFVIFGVQAVSIFRFCFHPPGRSNSVKSRSASSSLSTTNVEHDSFLNNFLGQLPVPFDEIIVVFLYWSKLFLQWCKRQLQSLLFICQHL